MDDEAVGWSESFNATTATYTAPSTITSVKTVTVTATCTPGGASGHGDDHATAAGDFK